MPHRAPGRPVSDHTSSGSAAAATVPRGCGEALPIRAPLTARYRGSWLAHASLESPWARSPRPMSRPLCGTCCHSQLGGSIPGDREQLHRLVGSLQLHSPHLTHRESPAQPFQASPERRGSPHPAPERRSARRVDTDRVKIKTISRKGNTIDPRFPGEPDFGGNIQAAGIPLWVLPGNVHDVPAVAARYDRSQPQRRRDLSNLTTKQHASNHGCGVAGQPDHERRHMSTIRTSSMDR